MRPPAVLEAIRRATDALGFSMASDDSVGNLLRTLVSAKPAARVLEIGTGTGLSTAWLLDGLDDRGAIVTVDDDPEVTAVAAEHLGSDRRLAIETADGSDVLRRLTERSFDLVFADSWPGKYHDLDLALRLIAPNGLYVIDDMLPQPNWPSDHAPKAAALLDTLDGLAGFSVARLDWATGIVIAVRIA